MSDTPSRNPENQPALRLDSHAEPTCDLAAEAAAAELVRILDEYLADLKAGQAPDRRQLLARHPALAAQLEACLAGLEFIHSTEQADERASQRLGDFRILREIGRGGMGAVYEAEQISLGRRVALKILRFGGVSDPEALERFQREAETVAKLHHTNIVPIFNLGSERGVNYYAMQFIEGRSLAEVLAEQNGPLPAEQVAEWGLQAAEALAHAHQRGVIHRDVKPSNLLVDRENRLWLTDFGLARRLDDVTLSMTGALLGTPRYMSPEQAAAARKRVDHRSDLFSLGATLYELLSGKPAFPGDTPHEVIQHILAAEPAPLRQVAGSTPRDLETIVMKCLAKEPGERYATARELAGDLRAFLDGRPIRARRTTPLERARRWVRQHRRSVALTGVAAAATLLLTVVGAVVWSGYDAWRQGGIRLDAVNPPLVAEFVDRRGETVRTETLPMQSAAKLPAGDYDLRVSAEGTLSQNFGLKLERGQTFDYTVNLNDPLLLGPLEMDGAYAVVDFEADRGLVFWTQEGVSLRRLRGPKLGWSMKLGPEHVSAMQSTPGFLWPWTSASVEHSGYGSYAYQPWVSPRAFDVNGDGVGDLLCAGRHQAWLMAVSGEDGSVLWFAPRSSQLLEPRPERWQSDPREIRGAVLGAPICGHDCDHDGVGDLIATLTDIEAAPLDQQKPYRCRKWVEAVSGKTGQTIWRHDLSDALFELPAEIEPPDDLQWFPGKLFGGGGSGSGGGRAGRHVVRDRPVFDRGTWFPNSPSDVYRPSAAELVLLAGRQCAALIAGRHAVLLDPDSGQTVEPPIDLGARPGKAPQWIDLDGDGSAELVFLEEAAAAGSMGARTARLYVWSYARREMLWSRLLDAYWPNRPGWTIDAPTWPLVADLNEDGKPEIVVPSGGARNVRRHGSDATPWGSLAVLAGETGAEIWTRRLVSIDCQADHFLDGPDLDGDGTRELFAVTQAGLDFTVYVDALSGANGRTLWTSHETPRDEDNWGDDYWPAPPRWWRSAPDGWPQLVVQLVDEDSRDRSSLTCAFSAGNGRLTHRGEGITAVEPADLDGDSLEELLTFKSKSQQQCDFGGRLQCVRGVGGRPWKLLGALGNPAADLDGDGVIDLVRSWADGTLVATSGASGQELWRCEAIRSSDEIGIKRAGSVDSAGHRLSAGDLDGDGVAELLAWERSSGRRSNFTPLHAVSGRTGRRLWTASEVNVTQIDATLAVASRDLDADGREEVLWLAALDYGFPAKNSHSSEDEQLWLFAISGQTGRLKWAAPLSPQFGLGTGKSSPFHFHEAKPTLECGDLNRDGVLDVLVPAIADDGALELRALSGKDGNLLWRRSRRPDRLSLQSLEAWISPTVCDLDGDGRVEIAVVEPSAQNIPTINPATPAVQAALLYGGTGDERWSHSTQAAFGRFGIYGRAPDDFVRPIVLRAGAGRQRLGIYLHDHYQDEIIVFSADGGREQRKIKTQPQPTGLRACDADGDGVDEIAFIDDATLFVAPADRLETPLWKRALGSIGQQQILATLPSQSGSPPVIVFAADPTDNSVLGLDALTGQTIWTCPGPIPRDAAGDIFMVPNQIALLGARQNETPLVYYAFNFAAECRQAARLAPAERPSARDAASHDVPPSSLAARGVAASPARLSGAGSDLRWRRDLPWRPERDSDRRGLIEMVGWGSFFAIAIVIAPFRYLTKLLGRRRWNLRTLLVLPAVAGLFLTAALAPAHVDRDVPNLMQRFLMGLFFVSPLLAIGELARWCATGRWKRVLLWLALVALFSAAAGGVALAVNLRQTPLEPEESFDWSGWYCILFIGGYLTACLCTIAMSIETLVNRARNSLGSPVARKTNVLEASNLADSSDVDAVVPRPSTLPSTVAAQGRRGGPS